MLSWAEHVKKFYNLGARSTDTMAATLGHAISASHELAWKQVSPYNLWISCLLAAIYSKEKVEFQNFMENLYACFLNDARITDLCSSYMQGINIIRLKHSGYPETTNATDNNKHRWNQQA